jgi:hypothetical protein
MQYSLIEEKNSDPLRGYSLSARPTFWTQKKGEKNLKVFFQDEASPGPRLYFCLQLWAVGAPGSLRTFAEHKYCVYTVAW